MKTYHRNKKSKNTAYYPEIAIGIFFIIIGIYARTIPGEYGNLANYSIWFIILGIFFSMLRLIVTILIRRSKQAKLLSATIYKIAEMDGKTFESCCIAHFKSQGYTALPTAASSDYGADIILKKNGEKIVVQCKRYKGKVGISAVQEVLGAKGYYKADKAMVITNSYFTPNAIKLANANDVELWDRNDLINKFNLIH